MHVIFMLQQGDIRNNGDHIDLLHKCNMILIDWIWGRHTTNKMDNYNT